MPCYKFPLNIAIIMGSSWEKSIMLYHVIYPVIYPIPMFPLYPIVSHCHIPSNISIGQSHPVSPCFSRIPWTFFPFEAHPKSARWSPVMGGRGFLCAGIGAISGWGTGVWENGGWEVLGMWMLK